MNQPKMKEVSWHLVDDAGRFWFTRITLEVDRDVDFECAHGGGIALLTSRKRVNACLSRRRQASSRAGPNENGNVTTRFGS